MSAAYEIRERDALMMDALLDEYVADMRRIWNTINLARRGNVNLNREFSIAMADVNRVAGKVDALFDSLNK